MKKLLLFACSVVLGMSAMAQNVDVTDQYLDNAGFDTSSDFISTGVCTYAKDVATNSADGSSLMPVTAWTAGATGDAKAGAAFGFGSDAFLTGTGFRVPAVNSDGNAEGGALGLGGCWDGDAIYTQALKKNLEAGTYTIEVVAYNAGTATVFGNQKFGIKTASKEYFSATTWTAHAWTKLSFNVTIDEDTEATFYVGGSKVAGGSDKSAKIFIDYVKIYKSKSLQDYMDEATEESPADVTNFYLQNAQVTGTDGWTNGRVNSGEQYDGAPDNTYLDAWNATFNMTQKVTLKPGKYTLKAATRAVSGISVANIYANIKDGSKNSTNITAVGNTDGELGNGWGWTTVDFLVMEEAEVTIGFYSECGNNKWAGADNFSLWYDRKIQTSDILEAPAQEIINLINSAVIPTANIGEGAFQYDADAIAQVQDDKDLYAEATAADMVKMLLNQFGEENALEVLEEYKEFVLADIEAMNTLNQPKAGQRFHLNLGGKGTTTFVENASAQSGYSVTFNATESDNYPQAFQLTPVAGATDVNMYTLSFTDVAGETRYICNGIPYGAGTGAYGIRTITDAEKALVVKVVATATEGEYNLLNTSIDGGYKKLGSNGGDFYTDDKYSTFTITEAGQIPGINITAAGYGTYIAPIDVTIPAGVKAYTATVVGISVSLTEIDDVIPAGTAVIVEGTETNQEAQGYAKVLPAAIEANGDLIGVYVATAAPVGSYVLQKQDKVGFYQVAEGAQPTVGANRCYLENESGARVLTFGEETAINAIDALTSGKAQIFDLNGRQLNSLQKGINIVNGVKILVK